MAVGKTLRSLVDKFRATDAAATPWLPRGSPYPVLATFDVAIIQAVPGLAAVWHLGVRPQWLKIAAAANLQTVIRAAALNPAFTSYRPNGGVYLSWAPLQSNEVRAAARFLIDRLKPVLQPIRLDGEVDVPPDVAAATFPYPPGTQS